MKSSTQYVSSSLKSVLVKKETSTVASFNKTTSDTLPHENTYTYSNTNTQPTTQAKYINKSLKSITTAKSIKQTLNFTKKNKNKLAYSKYSTSYNSNNSNKTIYLNITNYTSTDNENKTQNFVYSSKKPNLYSSKTSTTIYPFKQSSNISLVYNKNSTTFSPKSEKSLNKLNSQATSKNTYARNITSHTTYTRANIFLNTKLIPSSLETNKTLKKNLKKKLYLTHSTSQTKFTTQTNIMNKNEKTNILEQFNISNKSKIILSTTIKPTAHDEIIKINKSKELNVVFKTNKTVPKLLTELTSLLPQNLQNSTSLPNINSEFNTKISNEENLYTQIKTFPLTTTEKISYETTFRKLLPLISTKRNVHTKLKETTKYTKSKPTTTKALSEVEDQSITSTKAHQYTSLKHLLKNITGNNSKIKNAYKNSIIGFSKTDKPNTVKTMKNKSQNVLNSKSNNLFTNYIIRKKNNKMLTNTKVYLSLTEAMPIHKKNKTSTYLEITTKPSTKASVNNRTFTTTTKKEINYNGASATTMRADYYKSLLTDVVFFGNSTLKDIENNNSTLVNRVKTNKNMLSTDVPADNYFTVSSTDITGFTLYVSNQTLKSKVSKLIPLKNLNKVDTNEYNNVPKFNLFTMQYENSKNIKFKEKLSSQLIAPNTTNETKDLESVKKNINNKNTISQKIQKPVQKIVSLTNNSSNNVSTKLQNLKTSASNRFNLKENITFTNLEGNMSENIYYKEKTNTKNVHDFNDTFDYTKPVTASNINDSFTNNNENVFKYSTTVTDTLLLAENLELKLSSTKNKTSTTASMTQKSDFYDSTRIPTNNSFTDITLTKNLKKLPLFLIEVSNVNYLSKNIESTISSGIKNSASFTKINLPTMATKVMKKKTNPATIKKNTTHDKITNTNDGITTKFDPNHTLRNIITHESLKEQDLSGYSSGFEFERKKQMKKLNLEENGGESFKTTQINKDLFLRGNISEYTKKIIILHKNESYKSNKTLKTNSTKISSLYLLNDIKNTSSKQYNFSKISENLYNKSTLKRGFVKDTLKTSKLNKVPENIKQFYKKLDLKQKLELFEIMLDDILLNKIVEEKQELYHNRIRSYLNGNTNGFNTANTSEKKSYEQVNPVPAPPIKYISNNDLKVLEDYNTYSLKEKNNGNKIDLLEQKNISRPVYIRVTGTIALETYQTSLDSNFSLVGVTLLRNNKEKIRPKLLQQSDIVIELESYKKTTKSLEETKIRKVDNKTTCFCKQLRTENVANSYLKLNKNTTKNVDVLSEFGSGYYSSSGEEPPSKTKVR